MNKKIYFTTHENSKNYLVLYFLYRLFRISNYSVLQDLILKRVPGATAKKRKCFFYAIFKPTQYRISNFKKNPAS